MSKKLDRRAKARELYTSTLFKKAFAYAERLHPDRIFILSAKYGLVDVDDEIEPYNLTLNTMKDEEVKEWAERVLTALRKHADFERDEFVFLAGERYRKYLVPHLRHCEVPMKGLGIGRQLAFLTPHAA